MSKVSGAVDAFETFAVVLSVRRNDVVSSWLVRLVQLPVDDEEVEAFRPSPLQLSLVLVEVPAIDDEGICAPLKPESGAIYELEIASGDGYFC